MPTPYEIVKSKYTFPPYIKERVYQIDSIKSLAPLPRGSEDSAVNNKG